METDQDPEEWVHVQDADSVIAMPIPMPVLPWDPDTAEAWGADMEGVSTGDSATDRDIFPRPLMGTHHRLISVRKRKKNI